MHFEPELEQLLALQLAIGVDVVDHQHAAALAFLAARC